MKYKIQEHEEKVKEFIIYQLASNGEIYQEIARCRQQKHANLIMSLLINTDRHKFVNC